LKPNPPQNFRSKLIIHSNTLTPEETWGRSTLCPGLPPSKAYQCEIRGAERLVTGHVGFIRLAPGWALTAKSRRGSSAPGPGRAEEPAREEQVALETQRQEDKGWGWWRRSSGRAVRSKQVGAMRLVSTKELGQWNASASFRLLWSSLSHCCFVIVSLPALSLRCRPCHAPLTAALSLPSPQQLEQASWSFKPCPAKIFPP